jgi:hypothetical protein
MYILTLVLTLPMVYETVETRSNLAIRAKDEASTGNPGPGFSSNVAGVPVYGWALIGASLGIVLAWSLCYCYWRRSSYSKNNMNKNAMMSGGLSSPNGQPGMGF